MQAVVGGLQRKPIIRNIVDLKNRLKERIHIWQKPKLDEKVKEISLKKIQKISITLFTGKGRSIGKRVGSGLRRLGRSLKKGLKSLLK